MQQQNSPQAPAGEPVYEPAVWYPDRKPTGPVILDGAQRPIPRPAYRDPCDNGDPGEPSRVRQPLSRGVKVLLLLLAGLLLVFSAMLVSFGIWDARHPVSRTMPPASESAGKAASSQVQQIRKTVQICLSADLGATQKVGFQL